MTLPSAATFEPAGGPLPVGESEAARRRHGILPSQALRGLIAEGAIAAAIPIGEDQVQPASIDLRLGSIAYRVRASFLPGEGVAVSDRIATLGMHEVDLSAGAVLEKGCVYIVPLMESVRLGRRLVGMANPKSSAGRLDIFTRLIADGAVEFDTVREGYSGALYAEVSPRAFSVVVRAGDRLCQLRIRRGGTTSSDTATRRLHEEVRLVDGAEAGADIARGIAFSVDLRGSGEKALIGFRAKQHTDLIDISRIGHYDPLDFWDPIHAGREAFVLLNPGDFYILSSREAVTVPPDHAAEMTPYDTRVGEFRVHYAGFFDPGFGFAGSGGAGSRGVLEVRSHEVPFVLEHGQVVGRLVYERLTEAPDKIYGTTIGSSYQRQGLRLAKQFRQPAA